MQPVQRREGSFENPFAMLGMDCDEDESLPLGEWATWVGLALVQPKKAQPFDFDVGQALEKPNGRKNEPNRPKRISTSNKVKSKCLVHLEACLESVGGAGSPGAFIFLGITLRKEGIAIL